MIDTPLSEISVGATTESEALQQYVQALLSRQHALDLLEAIHQQTNDVWATIRRLLETTGGSIRTTASVRAARMAEAIEAKNTYRSLEQRREECIATLHQAELRANAALQTLVATRPHKNGPEHFTVNDFVQKRAHTPDGISSCAPKSQKQLIGRAPTSAFAGMTDAINEMRMKTFVTEKTAGRQEAKPVQHKPISLACSWHASPAQTVAIVNMTDRVEDSDFVRLPAGGSLTAGVIHRIFHGRCPVLAGKN